MPGLGGEHGGRADGRRRGATPHEVDRDVVRAGLRERASVPREPLELRGVEPDVHASVEHGDGRRHRAADAHGRFELARDLGFLGPRQAVGDQRRLERDDRRAGRCACGCGCDLGAAYELEHVRMIARVW